MRKITMVLLASLVIPPLYAQQIHELEVSSISITDETIVAMDSLEPFPVKWIKEFELETLIRYTQAEGSIFVTSQGTLYSLDRESAKTHWKMTLSKGKLSTPVYHRGRVLVDSSEGSLYIIHAKEGVILAKIAHEPGILNHPLCFNDLVFFVDRKQDPILRAFKIKEVSSVWNYKLKKLPKSMPLIANSKIIITDNESRCIAIQASGGETIWEYNTDEIISLSVDPNTGVVAIVKGQQKRYVDLIELETGLFKKNFELRYLDPFISTLFQGDLFIIGFESSHQGYRQVINCIDENGSVKWEALTEIVNPDTSFTAAICAGGYLFAGLGSSIRVFNYNSGDMEFEFLIPSGAELHKMLLSNANIYISTRDGRLISFKTGNSSPLPPVIFSPSDGENVLLNQPEISWAGSYDPDKDDIFSQIQIGIGLDAYDIDFNMFLLEILPANSSSFRIPRLLEDNTLVYFRVRVIDSKGAHSSWSRIQYFWVKRDALAPEYPSRLEVIGLDSKAKIYFSTSPSPDVIKYKIYYKPRDKSWAEATVVDNILCSPFLIEGLDNYVEYEFMLIATDAGLNDSVGVIATCIPAPRIILNGIKPYDNIQDAIDDAMQGDTIYLGAGNFKENIILSKDITIKGVSARSTRIIAEVSDEPVLIMHAGTIEDLTIKSGATGILIQAGKVLVKRVIIHDAKGDGIRIEKGAVADIINVTIINNLGNGISSDSPSCLIKNSIIYMNSGVGIDLSEGASVMYNNSYGNLAGNYAKTVRGTENISSPVIFTVEGLVSETFLISSSSFTVDAGDPADEYLNEPEPNGGRINQGAYGSTKFAAVTRKKVLPEDLLKGAREGGCYIKSKVKNEWFCLFILIIGTFLLAGRKNLKC